MQFCKNEGFLPLLLGFLQGLFPTFFLFFKDFAAFLFFFPVFCCLSCFFLFSSKKLEFLSSFLHRVPTDPGKPGRPCKTNQLYQSQEKELGIDESQGKVGDFFYTEGCVHILYFIFIND